MYIYIYIYICISIVCIGVSKKVLPVSIQGYAVMSVWRCM